MALFKNDKKKHRNKPKRGEQRVREIKNGEKNLNHTEKIETKTTTK